MNNEHFDPKEYGRMTVSKLEHSKAPSLKKAHSQDFDIGDLASSNYKNHPVNTKITLTSSFNSKYMG